MTSRILTPLVALATLAISSSCAGGQSTTPDPVDLAFTPLVSYLTHDLNVPHTEAFSDEVTFAAWWQESFDDTYFQVPDRPTVDFGTTTVVVIGLGSEGSSGRLMRLDRVRRDAGRTTIDYTVTTPGVNCGVLGVITIPVHVFAIPRGSAGDVTFSEHVTEGAPCDLF